MALNLATQTELPEEAGPNGTRIVATAANDPLPVQAVAEFFPQLEILEYLGRGGMGAVYKARQPRLDRVVALKILARGKESEARFAERFEREARALARLSHPHIVGVFDFGEVNGHCYLLMEYVDGANLRQVLHTGKMASAEALAIVPRICEALQYAHEQGVVHRDIKPENILLDRRGRVKIADFGIAKMLGHEGGPSLSTDGQQVVGTPHYMAPEQIERPQAVDHRADLYSLGVVFYEMLTGELPLGKFASPSEKAHVDSRLDKVVLHALEKEPDRRYQHASEIKTDVEVIATRQPKAGLSGAPTVAPATQAAATVRPHRLAWAGAGAAVLLGLLALAGWLVRQPHRPLQSSPGGVAGIRFPTDAGVVDVTQPPYNVKGDGRTDATAALQQALNDHRGRRAIIYLPDGVYLLSNTVRWGQGKGSGTLCKFTTLQGQSREKTILRLRDGCAGFGNPQTPQAVIWTGPKGGDRYRNALRDLTIETGRDNPGAIGVQFNANWGCLREVQILSGDGQGAIGLDMAFADEIGPLLVKNLAVRGFNVGVHTRGALNNLTFEHLRLEAQRLAAFVNDSSIVSLRDLVTRGNVPAFRNEGSLGLAVLLEATLHGEAGASRHVAILNRPGLLVRHLTVRGFAHAIAHSGPQPTNVPGPFVAEWASRSLPGSGASLAQPIQETPEVPWDDPALWANAVTFGAKPDDSGDDSDALQRAIDSGLPTVYLPRGEYVLRRPVQLRGKVRRLIGCEAMVHVTPPADGGAVLTLAAGEAPAVVVERLEVEGPEGWSGCRFIDNRSKRMLVLRDCSGISSEFTGPGDLFLENTSGRMVFHGQSVWARQFSQQTRHQMDRTDWWHLRNDGGRLWILGEMSTGPGPIVLTTGGGRTEVLGGMVYSSASAEEQPEPAFVVGEGVLSVSLAEVNHRNLAYPVLVRSVAEGRSSDLLLPSQAPGGVNASLIPLFATPARPTDR